jgi:hypothetical protein
MQQKESSEAGKTCPEPVAETFGGEGETPVALRAPSVSPSPPKPKKTTPGKSKLGRMMFCKLDGSGGSNQTYNSGEPRLKGGIKMILEGGN